MLKLISAAAEKRAAKSKTWTQLTGALTDAVFGRAALRVSCIAKKGEAAERPSLDAEKVACVVGMDYFVTESACFIKG